MISATLRRGLSLAALAAAAVLASCETGPTEAELEAQRIALEIASRRAPPVTMNASVAESASVYLTFARDIATLRGGFASAEDIQAALRRGASYDPVQLSRGMVAYASILALQSPEFVSGVQQFSIDPAQRQQMIANIVRDPAYAATLPGADHAAGLIIGTLGQDIEALTSAATSIEQDAYTIQERSDPRRAWAVQHITDRESRLQSAKTLSGGVMQPSADESARLIAAATSGTGLVVSSERRAPPYTPAVANALALAALAALGAAGDEARANTDALQNDASSQFCLNISKLNLYQCLAASRPSYEDMFCVGRHVVRDLASCAQGTSVVTPVITVGDPVEGGAAPRQTSISTPVPAPTITPSVPSATTSTLNSGTATPYTPGR